MHMSGLTVGRSREFSFIKAGRKLRIHRYRCKHDGSEMGKVEIMF